MKPDQLTQDLAMIGRNAIDALIAADKKREDANEVKAQCRALKIADMASIGMVENHGWKASDLIGHYIFDPELIASNDGLEEAIEHLLWRGLCTRIARTTWDGKYEEVEIVIHE